MLPTNGELKCEFEYKLTLLLSLMKCNIQGHSFRIPRAQSTMHSAGHTQSNGNFQFTKEEESDDKQKNVQRQVKTSKKKHNKSVLLLQCSTTYPVSIQSYKR